MEFGACFRHESKDGAVSEHSPDNWDELGVYIHCGATETKSEFVHCWRRCGVYFMEWKGTERNAGLFHRTDKCEHRTINLILEYLTQNGSI